jgi:hypothetical protein
MSPEEREEFILEIVSRVKREVIRDPMVHENLIE